VRKEVSDGGGTGTDMQEDRERRVGLSRSGVVGWVLTIPQGFQISAMGDMRPKESEERDENVSTHSTYAASLAPLLTRLRR
jgi:hypothetical protein